MSLKETIKKNSKLKKLIHYLLVPKGEARPRNWVRWFVNPVVHKQGKNSKIRGRVRMDILPFNSFSLGENSIIEDFSTINNGVGPVIIGSNSLIGMSNVVIGPVTIGNDVIIAQNIVISALNHSYEDISLPIHKQSVITRPVIIEDECWIGANSVITAGVTIGRHSVVAAGSVVTKDVPPLSVVAGNPARLLKQYDVAIKQWVRVDKVAST
jgi:acetyltransferase-like isoleucine patch superfamily enzyme